MRTDPESRGNTAFFLLLTVLTAGIVCFLGLDLRLLVSGDETRVAGIAAEMAVEGNYLVPKLNGYDFLEYPPLCYWLIAGAFHLFGICEAAAKLPSALAAFSSVLLVYFWCIRSRFRPLTAFLASFFLLTSCQFFDKIRHCTVDMLLAFFILLAWFAWTCSQKEPEAGKSSPLPRLGWLVLSGLAMGCGVMTKGLLGLVLPLSSIGISQVISDIRERKFHFPAYLRMAASFLIALIPAGWWCRMLYTNAGYDAFYTVAYTNNIGRFLGSQGDHVEPFYYYLCKFPEIFQPWFLLLLAALFFFWKERRSENIRRLQFPLCCLLIPFLLLFCAASKRLIYLLPLYAPCALLTAYGTTEFLYPRLKKYLDPAVAAFWNKRQLRLSILILVSLGIAGLFVTAALLVKHPAIYVMSGCALVLLWFGICWKGLTGKERILDVFCSFAFFLLAVDGTIFLYRDQQDHLRNLFADVSLFEQAGFEPVIMGHTERTYGASFFYLHHRVKQYNLPQSSGEAALQPEPGEVWIIRCREDIKAEGAKAYGDSHWLVFPVHTKIDRSN